MTKDEFNNLDVGDIVRRDKESGGDGVAYVVTINCKDEINVIAARVINVESSWSLVSKAGHKR